MWIVVVVTGLSAYVIGYLATNGAVGETAGHFAGLAALILVAAAWARWGPELPDIPD